MHVGQIPHDPRNHTWRKTTSGSGVEIEFFFSNVDLEYFLFVERSEISIVQFQIVAIKDGSAAARSKRLFVGQILYSLGSNELEGRSLEEVHSTLRRMEAERTAVRLSVLRQDGQATQNAMRQSTGRIPGLMSVACMDIGTIGVAVRVVNGT